MAFGDYVRVLRTYWKSILAVTVLGAAVGAGITFVMTPMYTASAQVLFTPDIGDGGGQDMAFAGTYAQGRMVNYADLVKSEKVLGPVVDQDDLRLNETPKQLSERVSGEFTTGSTVMTVNVEDENAETARKVAGAVAQSLITQVAAAELQAPIQDGQARAPRSSVTGVQISNPVKPDSASSPDLKLYAAGGTMLGLLLALAIALVRFVRSTSRPRPSVATAGQPVVPPRPVVPQVPAPPAPSVLTAMAQTEAPTNPKRSGKRTRR